MDGCTGVWNFIFCTLTDFTGFRVKLVWIECIESFDGDMKDTIKNLPVGVTLNGSATSNALAGRVEDLCLKANQILNQTF